MKKILFVDDDPNMHRMVELLLRSETDLEIVFAGNGRSALKQMERHTFDMVFSDIQMPEMDGMALLKHIRDENSKLPFVIISAFGQESMAQKALTAGASDVINKPFGREQIVNVIHKFI